MQVAHPLWSSGALARCTITDLELGFSASNTMEWDAIQSSLVFMEPLDVGRDEMIRALSVQRLLAARGQKGRKVADLLIAATAEAAGLTVLHYDRDFELIASVTGQPHQWIVPPGSVD